MIGIDEYRSDGSQRASQFSLRNQCQRLRFGRRRTRLDRRLEVAMKVRLEPAPVRGFRFAGVSAGLRNEPARWTWADRRRSRRCAAAAVFTSESGEGGAGVVIARNASSPEASAGDRGQFRIRQLLHRQGGPQARARFCDARRAARSAARRNWSCPASTGVIGHLYDLEQVSRRAFAMRWPRWRRTVSKISRARS